MLVARVVAQLKKRKKTITELLLTINAAVNDEIVEQQQQKATCSNAMLWCSFFSLLGFVAIKKKRKKVNIDLMAWVQGEKKPLVAFANTSFRP